MNLFLKKMLNDAVLKSGKFDVLDLYFPNISHVSNTGDPNLNVTSNTDKKKVNARLKIPFLKFKSGGKLKIRLSGKSIVKS